MTREQHERAAAYLGDKAHFYMPGHTAVRRAIEAAHHGRAALRCEACGGSGSTPLLGSRYAGANIRCPACGGVGWGTE